MRFLPLSSVFFCPARLFSCGGGWWGSGGVAPRARAGLFEMCSSSSSSFVPLKFVFPRENFILSILGREEKEKSVLLFENGIDYLLVSRDSNNWGERRDYLLLDTKPFASSTNTLKI